MIQSRRQRHPGPPRNPGLRELVAGKRRWSSPPNREQAQKGFQGWHERGYVPHRDQPGLVQFVTFELADAFPDALRSEWAALLALEDTPEHWTQFESYLDKGRGACHLRQPALARLVEEALCFHHGTHYDLQAWVVMANHVHVLLGVGERPMSQIVANWKEYTARCANKALGRRGPFWGKDYWDTYIRNTNHKLRVRNYIENNPVKAFLVRDPKDWSWSSARFRDPQGVLRLQTQQ